MKYVPDNVRIIKDNLFEPPVIFKLIQQSSGSDDKEMYQVFNMGTRLEIYTNEKDADNDHQHCKKIWCGCTGYWQGRRECEKRVHGYTSFYLVMKKRIDKMIVVYLSLHQQ